MDWSKNIESSLPSFPSKRKTAADPTEIQVMTTASPVESLSHLSSVPISNPHSSSVLLQTVPESTDIQLADNEHATSHLKHTTTNTPSLNDSGFVLWLSKISAPIFALLNAKNISILPYILLGYLRLAFHLTWLLAFGWSLWSLYAMLMNDIAIKVDAETNLVIREMERAKLLFFENKCFNEDIVRNSPALASLCAEWRAKAEQSDPRSKISRGRLMAETLAEILNAFVERITLRSLVRGSSWSLIFVDVLHNRNADGNILFAIAK